MAGPSANQVVESSWPGDREPLVHDVPLATEIPDNNVFSRFKKALVASHHALGNEVLIEDVQVRVHVTVTTSKDSLTQSKTREQASFRYTYPLALLQDFPKHVPPHDELQRRREAFSVAFAGHLFLNRLPVPSPLVEPITTPMRFIIGCLAEARNTDAVAETDGLFFAATGLWAAIMEVDNREARSFELLMTVRTFLSG
jgi:hypothetical protein